jgi:sorting nexin-9/18/33
MPPAGPSFYAQVYHPAYNVDTEDAQVAGDLFESHIKGVDAGVQDLRSTFTRIREARIGSYASLPSMKSV